jgi:hypothetical protein
MQCTWAAEKEKAHKLLKIRDRRTISPISQGIDDRHEIADIRIGDGKMTPAFFVTD